MLLFRFHVSGNPSSEPHAAGAWTLRPSARSAGDPGRVDSGSRPAAQPNVSARGNIRLLTKWGIRSCGHSPSLRGQQVTVACVWPKGCDVLSAPNGHLTSAHLGARNLRRPRRKCGDVPAAAQGGPRRPLRTLASLARSPTQGSVYRALQPAAWGFEKHFLSVSPGMGSNNLGKTNREI